MKLFNKLYKMFKLKNKKLKCNIKQKTQSKTSQPQVKNECTLENIGENILQDETLYKLSKFFSNFSDNTRLKIISCLSFGELCVGDISKVLNMNQTTISHQLAFLKSTGTVKSRRDGKTIYYFLAHQNIEECLLYGTNFISY